MAKATLQNLISTLHEHFGDDISSPQQQQLMQRMESHLHDLGEEDPIEPTFRETAELLLDDIEEQHPKAAAVTREILEVLSNIGV